MDNVEIIALVALVYDRVALLVDHFEHGVEDLALFGFIDELEQDVRLDCFRESFGGLQIFRYDLVVERKTRLVGCKFAECVSQRIHFKLAKDSFKKFTNSIDQPPELDDSQ